MAVAVSYNQHATAQCFDSHAEHQLCLILHSSGGRGLLPCRRYVQCDRSLLLHLTYPVVIVSRTRIQVASVLAVFVNQFACYTSVESTYMCRLESKIGRSGHDGFGPRTMTMDALGCQGGDPWVIRVDADARPRFVKVYIHFARMTAQHARSLSFGDELGTLLVRT
jgi:hypothetical protein